MAVSASLARPAAEPTAQLTEHSGKYRTTANQYQVNERHLFNKTAGFCERQRHTADQRPADRLSAAHTAVLRDGFTDERREELFRAAHDIKGDAVTFGFPSAAVAAESLCRIIEHAPDLNQVPPDLIEHHINAIQAIVRERTKLDTAVMANALSRQLRGVADEFLTRVNRDRPEHLEAILAPSLAPGE
jgi:HPt (histidine-containing phosphotransfer) domain-containing protein